MLTNLLSANIKVSSQLLNESRKCVFSIKNKKKKKKEKGVKNTRVMHDQDFLKLDYNQLDKWILLEMTQP